MVKGDLLVGLPPDIATQFEMHHGDKIRLSADGKTILLGDGTIHLVTSTLKGQLTRVAISKMIRQTTGLKDHRETGTDKAELVPFTVVTIDGQKVLWLKTTEKTAQEK